MSKSTVVILATLLAGSSAALAQKPDGSPAGGAPAAQQAAPGAVKEPGGSARDVAPGQTKPDGGSARDMAPGQRTMDRSAEQKGGEPSEKAQMKSDGKAGPRADAQKSDGPMNDRKSESTDKKSGSRAAETERREDRDQAGQRAEQDKDEKGAKQSAKGGNDRKKSAAGRASASIKSLPAEKQTKVRSVFREHRVPPANISISVNVGTVVPRRVKLYPVPSDIVVYLPAYRDYRYFLVGDRIVIVDPDDYEIVDVIVIA